MSESAARPSQETVVKCSEDTSQIMKTVNKTPKISAEDISEDAKNQDKTLVEGAKNSCEETIKPETVKLKYMDKGKKTIVSLIFSIIS